jgi:hypothetical protein
MWWKKKSILKIKFDDFFLGEKNIVTKYSLFYFCLFYFIFFSFWRNFTPSQKKKKEKKEKKNYCLQTLILELSHVCQFFKILKTFRQLL